MVDPNDQSSTDHFESPGLRPKGPTAGWTDQSVAGLVSLGHPVIIDGLDGLFLRHLGNDCYSSAGGVGETRNRPGYQKAVLICSFIPRVRVGSSQKWLDFPLLLPHKTAASKNPSYFRTAPTDPLHEPSFPDHSLTRCQGRISAGPLRCGPRPGCGGRRPLPSRRHRGLPPPQHPRGPARLRSVV